MWSAQFAFAGSPLTEAGLLEFVDQNPQWTELQQTQQQLADIKLRQAGRWTDPRFELSQETMERGGQNDRETSLWLKQDLSPWGMSALEQQLVEKRNQSEQLVLDIQRHALTRKLRQQFYSALDVQKQMDSVTRYQVQLSEMAKVIEQRWQQGDVSKLDLLRIQNELAAVNIELATLMKRRTIYFQSLSDWIGHPIHQLEGELLPNISSLKAAQLAQNPQLQQLALQLEQAEVAKQLAEKQRYWPDLNIGVGYKHSNEANTSDGFQIGLALSLPFFSQKHHAVKLAKTQGKQAGAEKDWLQKKLETELNRYLGLLDESIHQANQWQTMIEGQNRSIVEMAKASYRAGELTITELLDVYRSELNHNKNYLNSARQAREYFIQVQYLLGEIP